MRCGPLFRIGEDLTVPPTPAAGSRFDGNCLYTTDPGRFVKWGGQTYGSLAAFRQATGQEASGTQSPTCATP